MAPILLIAQAAPAGIAGWVIWLVVIAAVVGIALVALRAAGVAVPPFVIQIGWIVVCAVLAIAAIRFLLGVAGAW
jgi:hypothetical protein